MNVLNHRCTLSDEEANVDTSLSTQVQTLDVPGFSATVPFLFQNPTQDPSEVTKVHLAQRLV